MSKRVFVSLISTNAFIKLTFNDVYNIFTFNRQNNQLNDIFRRIIVEFQ